MNCKICQAALPDLLFESAAPSGASAQTGARARAETQTRLAAARAHIATCASCAQELASFEATFSVLDDWRAPALSPYFDQRLAVRLREQQSAPAAGWFEKIRTRLLLNTGRQFRPALAGVMALLLVIGGGSLGIATYPHPQAVQQSAAVNDLQILDKNEQALQQMDQLLEDDAPVDNSNPATPPQS